jgi:hypothetical protein
MKTFTTVLLAIVAAGCSSPAPEASGPAADNGAPASEERPFTVTKVSRGADGTETVTVNRVSAAEIGAGLRAHADVAAGRAVRPEDDHAFRTTCGQGSAPVNLYDNTLSACQSGCNEICFTDFACSPAPNIYLGSYCHTSACTESWNGLVRSYWTGSDGSYLWRHYNDGHDGTEVFPAPFRYENAGAVGQSSNYLVFAPWGPPLCP